MTIVRIPLTIVATASGQKTDGVIVAVAVSELDALEAENERLRATLIEAHAEIDRWGYGDFHYGETPRDPGVLAMLAKIDEVVAP